MSRPKAKARTCPVTGYACNYAYKHARCRCEQCVDALRERCYTTIQRALLRAHASKRVSNKNTKRCMFPENKPYTGYQYGCRCLRCAAGQAAAVARYRKRRKERQQHGSAQERNDV